MPSVQNILPIGTIPGEGTEALLVRSAAGRLGAI